MLRVVLFLTMVLAGSASAQTVLTFDKSNVKPGLALTYIDNKKRTRTTTLLSRTKFRSEDGETAVVNADGNSLKAGKTKFKPHSGIRPPGAGGALRVGMKWKHTYTRDKVKRTRNCRVAKSGTYKNKHLSVKNAFLIRCANKRADRPNGMQESIWVTPALLATLSYKASWGSGGYSWELKDVR